MKIFTFWLGGTEAFSNVNFVFANFTKKLGFGQTPAPPPPGWDKIPSLSKEINFRLPLCGHRRALFPIWVPNYKLLGPF